ncbi:hypothetical protein MKW92_037427 [Papaver armeniacum]|nr:hypothetical protein MKW92_037427 [Papaver armeniacum]
MPAIFSLEDLSSSVSADMHIWIKRKNNGKGVFLEIHAERKESYTQLTLRFLRGLHNAHVLKLNSSFFEDSLDISVHPFCDEVKLNSENIGGLGLPDMAYHLNVNELKLLAGLLKHALVLEKVVLCSLSTKEELKQKEKEMEKFYKMLVTFPKASTNVMISYSVYEGTTFSTA